jgi:hypothetical protein
VIAAMRSPLRPLVLLAAGLVLAVALGACGAKEEETTRGETEGSYLDLGELKYQVQISRELTVADREDEAYLRGVPEDERELAPNETWFAIFLRVQNVTDEAHPAAEELEIRDTQGEVFEPVELGPENVFAYRPAEVLADQTIPLPDTPAAENTIQGSLVLFKIPYANLENRPLELEIRDPVAADRVVSVDLDI